jgi:hypothetical protein
MMDVTRMGAIRRWFSTHDGLNVAIALFTLLLLGALWAAVITEKRAERDAVIAAAINQNTNVAVAYEENIVRTLKLLDGAMLFIRHEHQRLSAGMDIKRYIDERVIDGTQFSILSVVDEKGNVIRSSKPIDSVNYADRDFFRVHRLQPDQDALYIDKPVLGRVSNTWQVPISRRISKPDGSFGGVIVLSVDPANLARFYQKVDIGRNGVVMLIGTDGVIRARRVGNHPDARAGKKANRRNSRWRRRRRHTAVCQLPHLAGLSAGGGGWLRAGRGARRFQPLPRS